MDPFEEVELTEAEAQQFQMILERDTATSKLEAGHELDTLIATKLKTDIQPYSTDWATATQAVESLIAKYGYGFTLQSIEPIIVKDKWRAEFFDGDPVICNGVGHVSNFQSWLAAAKTGPLAICRAISLLPNR